MKVVFWYEDELEELDIPIHDLSVFVALVREYGYEDSEGNRYTFATARVEAKNKFFIYLTPED